MGKWTYNESEPDIVDTQTYNAIWDGESPSIDLTGLYLTVGIRFIHIR